MRQAKHHINKLENYIAKLEIMKVMQDHLRCMNLTEIDMLTQREYALSKTRKKWK
jgi:hypothetical protein